MTGDWNGRQDSTLTGAIRWDSSWPESAKEESHELLSYLDQRFGIEKDIFDDYLLFKKNKCWWLLRKSGLIGQAASLKVWTTGLKAFHAVGRYTKPTTRMIQVFGHHATRAVLNICEDDLKKMADGKQISSDMEIDNGYIILSFYGAVLGLGLFIEGRVSSQVPRRDLILIA